MDCLNPTIRVSRSFSRGGVDEAISRQVEEIIQELNQEGKLTEFGVESAYQLAGEIVIAANQIQQNGETKQDRIEVAKAKLQEFKAFTSDDKIIAEMFVNDFEFVLQNCRVLIPEEQQTRLEKFIKELNLAIAANNVSGMQNLTEKATQELNNLPDSVRLIMICKDTIGKAYHIAPTHARAMEMKFSQILNAIEVGNGAAADRLLQELLPDVRQYLDEKLPTSSIATGLTK